MGDQKQKGVFTGASGEKREVVWTKWKNVPLGVGKAEASIYVTGAAYGRNCTRTFFSGSEWWDALLEEMEEKRMREAARGVLEEFFKPKDVIRDLDKRVVGQERAKKELAVAVSLNLCRPKLHALGISKGKLPKKLNILLFGPTASGKTFIAQALAESFDVPFVLTPATQYSAAGYVGLDVEDTIRRLLEQAGNDWEKAKSGIVFIDEIDKLRTRRVGDVGCQAVQESLLTLVEGSSPVVLSNRNKEDKVFDASNVTFIAAGAFSGLEEIYRARLEKETDFTENGNIDGCDQTTAADFREFGMIPELVGRFPVRVPLKRLSEEGFTQVIDQAEESPIRQYEEFFRCAGSRCEFTEDEKRDLARQAARQETGVRALDGVVFESVLDELLGLQVDKGPCDLPPFISEDILSLLNDNL